MTDRYISVKSLKNKLPSADVVEVVRCKDCKYFIGEHKNGQGICCCGIKDTNYNAEFKPYADDFCSYGERRENEQIGFNKHKSEMV